MQRKLDKWDKSEEMDLCSKLHWNRGRDFECVRILESFSQWVTTENAKHLETQAYPSYQSQETEKYYFLLFQCRMCRIKLKLFS